MMHTHQTNAEMKKVSPITTVKDCLSKTLSTCISMTALTYIGSINQVLKYTARVTSHPVSITAFQSFDFRTAPRVSQLKHDLYSIVLSNKIVCSTQTLTLQQSQLPVTLYEEKQYLIVYAMLTTVKQKVQAQTVNLTGNTTMEFLTS
jgi:hypothetical protein